MAKKYDKEFKMQTVQLVKTENQLHKSLEKSDCTRTRCTVGWKS
jgi:hypothetical protein